MYRVIASAARPLALAALAAVPVAVSAALGGATLHTVGADLLAQHERREAEAVDIGAALVSKSLEDDTDVVSAYAERSRVATALASGDRTTLEAALGEMLALAAPANAALGLDARGTLVARSPDAPTVGESFATRDYFTGALARRGSYVSIAFRQAAAPSPVVVGVAQRAGDSGVLALTIPVSTLLQSLDPIVHEGRELLLVDRQGVVVATNGPADPLTRVAVPALADALAGRTGVGADGEGARRMIAYAGVDATPWALYVIDDPAIALRHERDALSQLATAMDSAVLLAGLLGVLAASGFFYVTEQGRRLARANEGLRTATAEAERATRAKSEFLANMSHELRTPLNAVLGFSEVLQEQLGSSLSDRQRRYLDNIYTGGRHLLDLINDVLDLSRVEAGRLMLRTEPAAIVQVLEPVLAEVEQLATQAGVVFGRAVIPDAVVIVDPARIRQILLNLLSNAIKFTPAGGTVELRVSTHGGGLRFDVTDTGIGIPADKRERVFGVFERLHEGRSQAQGTGLGLALTKRLVELHGGRVDFTSTEGAGAHFWVEIPDVAVTPAVGPRVLVVENDAADAELLAEIARGLGHAVEVAGTAGAALAAVARSAPRAIILDLRLPDRRGDEVLVAVKADHATAHIPVLVVSVEDDDGKQRLLGADDHMTKPIEVERVRGWLDRAIGGGRDAHPAG